MKQPIGIMTAMRLEAEHILQHMDHIATQRLAGRRFYTGILSGAATVLCVSGVGAINAAVYTQLLIDRFAPSCILHCGIAGALSPEIPYQAPVVADAVTFYDMEDGQKSGCFPHCDAFPADPALADLLQYSAGDSGMRGLLLTGNRFIADRESRQELLLRFPGALCADMESGGVAHAAYVNQIPFAVVRCISDHADQEAARDAGTYAQQAADRAASMICRAAGEDFPLFQK